MRTEYVFNVETGALAYSREVLESGNHVYTVNRRDEMGTQQLCSIIVVENFAAEREFFAHFGDDSSWPPGWWARWSADKFTRESWTRENYPASKVSWQEYFGMHEF